MIYIKVNNTLYSATIDGKTVDYEWDKRETKSITLTMSYAEALALLPDNTPWSIVQKNTVPVYDADTGEQTGTTVEENEYDNSEYSLSGVITDNRNGTVTIKMGKPSEIESILSELESEVS